MVELNTENRQLFGEQVNDHIEKLNELMGLTSGESFGGDNIRKVCLATKLLVGSTRMLGLSEWSRTLDMLKQLLERSVVAGRSWDELLSQVVSEILETEEQAVAEILTGDVEAIDTTGSFGGLQREIDVILKEVFDADTGSDAGMKSASLSIKKNEYLDEPARGFSTMRKLMESLERVSKGFAEYIESPARGEDKFGEIEHSFGESRFLIGLVENILKRLGSSNRSFLPTVTGATVLEGVRDFFNLHSRLRGWNACLETLADEFSMEQDPASALAQVLEHCLFDTCRMHECKRDAKLEVKVTVKDEGSFLVVTCSDNGADFMCDSEVDREDAAAFYPGLLSIRTILKRWMGLLSVEPEKGNAARFRFTFPLSGRRTTYRIITASAKQFAVQARSVESITEMNDSEFIREINKQYVIRAGERIPVYRLDELAAEEIGTAGDDSQVMFVGLADERVGIMIERENQRVEGIVEQLTEGNWASLTKQCLHLGEDEFPVIDARLVLEKARYLNRLDNIEEETGSFVCMEEGGSGCNEETVPRV